LEELAALRKGSKSHGQYQLSAFDNDVKIQKLLKVEDGPSGLSFLLWREMNEEVVLQLQGLLLSCALPPITNRTVGHTVIIVSCYLLVSRFPIHRAQTLKQMVTLCGPNSEHFKASFSALKQIHGYIDKNFAVGEVHPFEATSTADIKTIVAGTQLLTPSENNPWATRYLMPAIDPDNVLRGLVHGGKYKFTEDNVVTYLEMMYDEMEGYVFFRGH
jgi:hypothetical protein